MTIQRFLFILFISCFSVTLTACGGDSSSSGGGGGEKSDTKNPAAGSKEANIELYGVDFDKSNFKKAGDKKPVVLLDDEEQGYSGAGMTLPEGKETATPKSSPVPRNDSPDTFSPRVASAVDDVKDALTNDGASYTELVNREGAGIQGRIAVFFLDVDYDATTTSSSDVRNLLIAALGSDAEVATLPQTGQQDVSEFRVALSFVETDAQPLVWAAAFPKENEQEVKGTYGDLNNGSSVVTHGTQKRLKNKQESFRQTEDASAGVDILWVIDNSGSMSEEQENLADGVDQFFDQLNNAGVDFRLAATTTDGRDCAELRPLPDDDTVNFIDSNTAEGKKQWSGESGGIARPGTRGSATETGFYCADKADTTGFDRGDADDIVVFVSDEPERETASNNAPSGSGSYVKRNFETYKQRFLSTGATYFAIVGEHEQVRPTFNDSYGATYLTSCSGDGGSADGGSHYRKIASLTGGSSSSICSDASDWSVMYNEIIETATGLASNFELADQALPSSVVVEVNGNAVARDTNHADGFDVIRVQDKSALAFYGAAIPEDGDTITVSYDYLPE